MTTRPALIAAAVLAGFLLLRVVADARAQAEAEADDAGEGGGTLLDYVNPLGAVESAVNDYQATQAMRSPNAAAFLAMISAAEGTNRGADPYAVCYGYRFTIRDFSDHPAELGTWKGEPLDNLGQAYVGKRSTAAGRYQIILPTWRMCKRALGLTDFSPESQDKAALYLIKKRGALDLVESGFVAEAVAKCRLEWASLPGAGYGQPERQLASLIDTYQRNGGTLA